MNRLLINFFLCCKLAKKISELYLYYKGVSHKLAKNVIDWLKIDNFGFSSQIVLAQTVLDITELKWKNKSF